MTARRTSPPWWLFGLVALALLLALRQGPLSARQAFLNNTDNRIGNPIFESWNLAITLPEEWSVGGYSGGGTQTWDNLNRTTDPVHSGLYSAGFENKGMGIGTPTEDDCDNWCFWYSAMTYVGSNQPLNAQIWFYPVSFVSYNATLPNEGVRLTIRYYNQTTTAAPTCDPGAGTVTVNSTVWCYFGLGVPDGRTSGDYHLHEPQFGTPGWRAINFTNRLSPIGATHMRFYLEIGTLIDQNLFRTTFYLDDPWIEAGDITPECQAGQVQNCTSGGNPGNQTCANGRWASCEVCISSYTDCGAWTPCTGGTRSHDCADATCGRDNQTITASCAPILDSINAFMAGTLTMPQLLAIIAAYRAEGAAAVPDPVLVARFDAQYAAHPPLNTVDYFGWEGARAQRSLLTMYDVTRDTAYLDKFLTLAAVQRNNWPTRWSGGNWEDDSAQSGNVISQYVRFAYYVMRDDLANYTAQAQDYYGFSRDNFLDRWAQDFKAFMVSGQQMGCIPTIYSNGTWVCDRWNAVAGIAEALLYANLRTPNVTYLDVATRHVRFFKANLHIVADCDGAGQRYEWGYRTGNTGQPGDVMPLGTTGGTCNGGTVGWGRWECGDEEEAHYAAYELDMTYTFWRQRLIFTDADIDLFTNTFRGMWNNDAAEPNRMAWVRCWSENSQANRHNAYETGYIHGFARFGNRDSTLLASYDTILDKVTANLNSTGDSEYYWCVVKADQSRVCYTPDNRTVEREIYLLVTADLLATHYEAP